MIVIEPYRSTPVPEEVTDLFACSGTVRAANDTSDAVGCRIADGFYDRGCIRCYN